MSSYEYELKYSKDKDQGNCDAVSQLPLPDCSDTVPPSLSLQGENSFSAFDSNFEAKATGFSTLLG